MATRTGGGFGGDWAWPVWGLATVIVVIARRALRRGGRRRFSNPGRQVRHGRYSEIKRRW